MNALIIMTRIPVPCKTKTRLMKILTGQQCADIHKCFLKDVFNMCKSLKESTDIYVTYSDEGDFSIIESLVPSFARVFPQKGKDIGQRMENAVGEILKKGYEKVVLIGSDIPEIQIKDILRAFDILEYKDLCFGPTFDGGYYLVGMKKLNKIVFKEDIKWGDKSVFYSTMDLLNKENLTVDFTEKYEDIDTKEDLKNLIYRLNYKLHKYDIIPKNTKKYLENWWRDEDAERYVD
ncbi:MULTISPECIES: TIGR04282 family arsenosugar biosynthesis glycosyltransferase [Clostridium]|uniref:TIGR04282 family arsenosugar biosynthesis glycosyltransferase n=1 Tax=Clostridium TaxID=1485 RepID=UPI0005F99286|nr:MULTISPECIES: TIGR04282 family arsenosugar biosynthesis glycosyltransferase [Clostridium]APF26484.1 guanylyl transferase CofC like family protein [Clostridium sporogenes]MDI6921302.1 TIGR04282 family arsenosugar biosynthesis glycosyltransferase [Clostridium botulinum]WMU96670.1 TIGR04282 family arsenosugar biosynthesis glycosyltransferase [Clostridium botulinum]